MGQQAQAASHHQRPKLTHVPRPAATNTWAAKAGGPSYNPSPLRVAESRPTPAVPAQAKPAAAVSRPEDEVDMFWNFQDTKTTPAPAANKPAPQNPRAVSGTKKQQKEVSRNR